MAHNCMEHRSIGTGDCAGCIRLGIPEASRVTGIKYVPLGMPIPCPSCAAKDTTIEWVEDLFLGTLPDYPDMENVHLLHELRRKLGRM